LVRDATKVLLTVPTHKGTAAISFAIAANGTLAQIASDPLMTILRSEEREILLPLNALDNIRAYDKQLAPPSGTVIGISRSTDDDTADRLRVQVGADDLEGLSKAKDGDFIRLGKTGSLSGVYPVEEVNNGTFTVTPATKLDNLGEWEKVETEDTGLVFDGLVTQYQQTADGKLRISAVNHGLEKGDYVQIIGDANYDGEYPILKLDTNTFTIQRVWDSAQAINIRLESRKRRGMTGTSATSDQFFRHVPDMRSQYGSLFPASYFRLKDAYALKAQIDEQDKLHQAYFNQFNAGLVDETSLDRQLNDSSRDGKPVGVDNEDRSGGESSSADKELDDKITAKEKEVDALKKAIPVDEKAVQKATDELETLKQERNKRQQAQEQKKGEKRQDAISQSHSDLSARANASESFAGWQKKMESLQIRAGKRNIVNTYVWDGDGGFHAEEQQFASTVEHTIGGSFELGFALGGELGFGVFGAKVECSAQAKVAMTQTMNKTEASSKGLELHVDLSGVESRNITDYKDRPILPGEKVDRYRFMSFYLEGSTRNWHDFFNTVGDPEWLASNDEEARALREAQSVAPNKVWRVLHRVTYVERPALMGFGRLSSSSDEAVDDIRALRDQLAELNTKVLTMQQELNEKLNQLLTRK